jgi:hypothetical protein
MSEIFCHAANETVNGHLCDPVADDCIHGLSHSAERRFVNAPEIQLRFGGGQWVDGKLSLHEREQAWLGGALPFELQPCDRSRQRGIKKFFLNVLDGNSDVGPDPDTAYVDV